MTTLREEWWLTDKAQCLACWHEWIAVWPIGADDLECPKCGSTDTVRGEEQ